MVKEFSIEEAFKSYVDSTKPGEPVKPNIITSQQLKHSRKHGWYWHRWPDHHQWAITHIGPIKVVDPPEGDYVGPLEPPND